MRINKTLILIFCLLISSFVYAQEEPNQGQMPPGGHKRQGNNQQDKNYKPTSQDMVFRELNDMVKQLSLTDSQTVLVKDILTNFHQSMDQMMQKNDKSKDDMKEVMDTKDKNLKAVLTDDQWTKYQDMKSEQKKKFDKKPKHNTE